MSVAREHLASYVDQDREALLRLHLRAAHSLDLGSSMFPDERDGDVAAHDRAHRPRLPRGQRLFGEFTQDAGMTSVIESSVPAGVCVWIMQRRRGASEAVHLSVEDARRVRDALDLFIEEATAGDLTATVDDPAGVSGV